MTDTPDPIDVEVGARVRLLRKQRQLSQGALADALGLTFQQVQKYERGANRISASVLTKIANKLNVPPSELLGEAEGEKPASEIHAALVVPGTTELVAAYASLSPELRRALLNFTRSMAREPVLRVVPDI